MPFIISTIRNIEKLVNFIKLHYGEIKITTKFTDIFFKICILSVLIFNILCF